MRDCTWLFNGPSTAESTQLSYFSGFLVFFSFFFLVFSHGKSHYYSNICQIMFLTWSLNLGLTFWNLFRVSSTGFSFQFWKLLVEWDLRPIEVISNNIFAWSLLWLDLCDSETSLCLSSPASVSSSETSAMLLYVNHVQLLDQQYWIQRALLKPRVLLLRGLSFHCHFYYSSLCSSPPFSINQGIWCIYIYYVYLVTSEVI